MVWIIQFILGLERRDLEHRGQRRMMQDNGELAGGMGRCGSGRRAAVRRGGRIRQYTTAAGDPMAYGVEMFEYEARPSVWFPVVPRRNCGLAVVHHEGVGHIGAYPLGMQSRRCTWTIR